MAKRYLLLALGVVAVSFAALLIREADAPPLVIAAYRLSVASLVLLPVGFRRSVGELRGLPVRDLWLMVLAGGCLALHFALWITSLSYTSVATSVVLVTASPIFLAVASRFLFGQRLALMTITGIAISLVGAAAISYGNWQLGARSLEGSLLAIGGALAISGYLLIGQRVRTQVGILSYTSVVYATAAAVLIVAAVGSGRSFAGYSSYTYLMMALLALVPQLIGHSLLNWSLRFVPATFVAVAVLGEPVSATAWAFLFLGEVPAPIEVAGGLLVLGGIFLALRGAPAVPAREEIA